MTHPPTAKEFEREYADRLGISPGEMDQRVRELRNADLLPLGGRGPHAPSITPWHAALIILSAVSPRATGSGIIARRAALLKPAAGSSTPFECFGEMLAYALTGLSPTRRPIRPPARITVAEDGSLGWATYRRSGAFTTIDEAYSDDSTFPALSRGQELDLNFVGRRFIIGNEIIRQLGALFVHEGHEQGDAGDKSGPE